MSELIFRETKLPGAFLIELTKAEDERGYFTRTFCRREFEEHGLNPKVAQCGVSFNKRKGVLRGMHFQTPPFAEVKLVRCVAGSIYDVIIDLRPGSATYKQSFAVELSARGQTMLYVPEQFAHGFQTLEDGSAVFYQISQFYSPQHARGVRWDDPAFGIDWPPAERTINERDRSYPDFRS